MTTARDIVYAAMKEIGAHAPGESVEDADAEDCFNVLNDMLAMWSNENLACYAYQVQDFNTVGNQAAYTIGPVAADITATRPLKIEQAWINSTGGFKLPIGPVIDQRDFNLLNGIEAGQPRALFYDTQAPLGVIRLWPKPNKVFALSFMSYLQFTRFASLNTVVQLPNGYEGALKKNLAIEIAPLFGQTPQPITLALAADYKGKLKSKNIRIPTMKFDSALRTRRVRVGNILMGT